MQKRAGCVVLAVAGLCGACPRAGTSAAPDASPSASASTSTSAAAPAVALATAVEETVAGAAVLPARVWVAQIKATPDQAEAVALAGALQRAGVADATVHRADLGAKGIWFRVAVGVFPRRDVLEARAPAVVETAAVKNAVGPTPEGSPAFVALEVPRFVATPPVLLAGLRKVLDGVKEPASPWVTGGGASARAVAVVNGSITVLGADGAVKETFPVPAAGCASCAAQAESPTLLFVGDVARDAEPELLVGLGHDGARDAAWLMRQGKGYAVVAGATVESGEDNRRRVLEWSWRNLDTDEDLEWLLTGAELGFHEGQSVCNAVTAAEAFDATGSGARPMDARLHAANGVARQQGGAEEIRAFLKGVGDRAPDLALNAALAYLAEAPDDAEMYRDVVARAEAAGREGRKGAQLRALAGLVAARHEWRVGLAPRLHDVLPAARAYLGNLEGCDTAPLLTGAAAKKARHDPKEALAAAARRPDARQLSPAQLAALMTAFESGSPLAQDVTALVELLEQRAPALVADARAAVATRRAGATSGPPGVLLLGRSDGGAARVGPPAPLPPARMEDEP